MADSDRVEADRLSIIPYDNNRDIVLRHANTIVYLDPQTQTLVPSRHNNNHLDAHNSRNHDCPTCGRPWHPSSTSTAQDGASQTADAEANFITNDYFQMLARSLPGSAQPSAPPSPRRRLAQPVRSAPVRSRLGSPLTDPQTPPEGEFVGSAPAPPSASNGISETAFAPQYFEKFFKVERELGRGGRGVVLLVQHLLDGVPLGHFACKRVPIGDDHAWLEKVLIEVQLLTQLSHQNLVSYRHVWLEDHQVNAFSPTVPCAFILQQYCNGGDLHNYICGPAQATTTTQQLKERIRRRSRGEAEVPSFQPESKKLHFDEIYSFFRDITAGLRFLHLSGFIHRDLKPSNCLLHTVSHETRVLVSDFGEVQYESVARKSTGATGTISYCAPEVLQRVSSDGPFGNFTFKSDIFSLGMILHFLCFANLPYISADVLHEDREDVDKLRAEIVGWGGFDDRKKLRPDLPSELYPFLKRLLSVQPDYRPTAEEVNRGMSTGRLSDLMPESGRRRGSGGQVPVEELTPGKRIQKLDTPKEGNSPTRGGTNSPSPSGNNSTTAISAAELRLGRPSRQLFNTRSKSRERVKPSSRLSQDIKLNTDETYQNSDSDTYPPEATSQDDAEPESNDDRDARPIYANNTTHPLSSSIVLRPRQRHAATAVSASLPSSPTHDSSHHQHQNTSPRASSPERKAQLLLPPTSPPDPPSLMSRITSFFDTPIIAPGLRASILLLKVLSVLQPCLSGSGSSIVPNYSGGGAGGGGLNPKVVYPLIVLAVAEYAILGVVEVWKALILGIVHFSLVGLAVRMGVVCGSGSATTWLGGAGAHRHGIGDGWLDD